MRLCFLTRGYALYPPFGGIATYVRDAAQWLASRGHDVQVVCVNRNHTPHVAQDGLVKVYFVGPRRIRPRRLLRLGARLPGLRGLLEAYSGWGLLENSLGGWAMVHKLSRSAPFDLIECDDFEGLAFWGLWPIHRYRILLRGHGIIHLDMPFARHPGARFHHCLEKLCAHRADFILTNSRDLTHAYHMELGLGHSRIASLPVPFEAPTVSCQGGKDRKTNGEATVLYVGRLEHRKGTDVLFAALEEVHHHFAGVHCVLVGAPESEFEELLDAFLRSNSDWVTHTGALPQSQVFEHMACADILVLPSRTESLGRTLIEAQALGLPQVATRVGGIPEVVEDRVTGILTESGDATALADAILILCKDTQLRARMAAASRSNALSRFDPTNIMEQQLSLYKALAKGRGRSGTLTMVQDRYDDAKLDR